MDKVTRVYKVTNMLDGKAYIGATTRTLEARWSSHLRALKTSSEGYRLHAAIRRDGIQNFRVELIEECSTRVRGLKREGELITALKTNWPQGYNALFQGAKKPPDSDETRAKKSAGHRGTKWNDAQRKAITAAQQTPEYRAKMRAASAKVKRGPLSEEAKAKIRASAKKNWSKPEYQTKHKKGLKKWREEN